MRPPRAAVLLRILEELNNLDELLFRLVDPRDVVKAHAGVGFDVNLGLALANGHQAAAQSPHAPRDESPQPEEEGDRDDPGEQILKERAFHLAGVLDAVLLQLLGKLRIDPRGNELALAVRQRLLELALDVTIGDPDLGNLPVAQ